MTKIYHLRDIKTHKLVAVGGIERETLDLVDGTEDAVSSNPCVAYATGWTSKQDAATKAGDIMDDFSHALAGITLEVIAIEF